MRKKKMPRQNVLFMHAAPSSVCKDCVIAVCVFLVCRHTENQGFK